MIGGGGEMGALVRAFDWRTTPVGAIEQWPQRLKAMVNFLVTSRFSMWMGWGQELTFFYNDAYARDTLGAKHPGALGRPFREVWAEIWGDLEPRIQHVLSTGEATWDEALLLFLERNGYPEETYHTFSYSPLTGDDGKIAGMFCVVMEETARVISDRRLTTLRELASSLATVTSEADVLDAATAVLRTNGRDLPFTLTYLFEEDGARARLVGATGLEAGHPAAPPVLETDAGADTGAGSLESPWPGAALVSSGGTITVEDLAKRFGALPTGAWDRPPARAVLVPIAEAGQERPAGFLVVGLNPYRAFDSTYAGFIELVAGQIAASLASARAYDAELRRAEQLEKLDRAKTTFFSNVSHELRTPLTLLLGPLDDVLRNPAVSPDVRPELDLAHRNALRLLKLVNTLLDFSRIEAGRVEAVYEPTDLVTFTAELASNFRSAMERGGIRLLISADTDATPESGARAREAVYVDREMWEKIVLNLLSNAFKHTFEGEVAVTVVDRADHAELVVRDTGVGIPASEIPHLFERFRRVPNARSRTHEGTGIGLALVQELVRLHGGSISVESEEGVGTTFRVRVPRGTAHLPAERIGAARLQSSTAVGSTAFTEQALRWLPDLPAPDEIWDELPDTPPAATPSVDLPGRILLADDNADMREYASRLLRSRGWEVEAVPDGQAALDALQRVRPDLVLSDVMMPRLDGFGLLRAMRASPATRDVPLILLSARAGEESRVEGLDAGADDYLVKPFSARELVARVGAHLTLARLRAQALAEVEAARAALEVANAQLQAQAAELEMQAEQLRVTVEELARRTEEAEHHRRVAESAEAHLRTTFDQAPVAIAVLRGPDHRFVLANPRYLDLVDRRPVTGCPIRAALPELEGQGVFELLDRVYSTSTPYVGTEFRAELVDPATGERREVFVNFVYQPLVAPDGDVEGIAVVATDVTTLVQSRRVAEAAQRDAEEANRAKSEFLAAMSHELRTPLNAIAGHAQLMEMEIHGPITPEQRAALARVQQSEQHLLSLINDVLNFAKLEAGRVEFDLDDVTLGDAVGHVVAMIEPQFIARELVCDIDVADGIVVRADDEKLRQILLNLLSNAVKFTGPGGRITIEATVDSGAPPSTGDGVLAPGLVRLDVTDTGVGIPDDRQRAIFEPFVQVHRQRTESTSGTGLGLTISRDLARGMGGDLTVDSTVGVGSTFTLTLPLGGAHAPADRAVSRTAARE